MDSDQYIETMIINIHHLDRVAKQTYNQICELSLTNPPITQHEFVRTWKTLILYRAQNVYECQTGTPPPNRIRLAPSVTLPRPLADIIYSIGRWQSSANGVNYDIRPLARPDADIPQWWTVDPDITTKWQTFLSRASIYYLCVEMPRRYDFNGLPIAIISVRQTGQEVPSPIAHK